MADAANLPTLEDQLMIEYESFGDEISSASEWTALSCTLY